MGFFDWLFGKSATPAPAQTDERGPVPAPVATAERTQTPTVLPANSAGPSGGSKPRAQPVPGRSVAAEPRPEALEVRNLRRWKESGQARAWVEARNGQWGHAEWLALLETLKRSDLWPMQPEAVGVTLEETRHEWLLRRNGATAGR